MSLRETNSRSAQFVQAIFDNTMAVIYAKDAEGRYQFINHRFEELFGIASKDVRGRTDFDIFPIELAERFHLNDQTTLREQRAIEFEEVAPHADGPHTYISLKFPYRDDNGECIGTCGISTDITPRIIVEEALQRSEERFRQLAENVPECFWITDTKTWQVLYVSPAFERIWQRPCAEIYDDPEAWIQAIHPDDRQRVADAFFEKATIGLFQEVYRIVQPDGQIRWIADRGFPVRNAKGEVYRVAGVAVDVTERRQLEQQVTEISGHERQRISRDLHDSLGQQLTGLGYMAKSLTNRLVESLHTEQSLAQDILRGLQDAVAEVRRIVRGLAPVDVDTFGLKIALQDLASVTGKYSDLECEFECPQTIAIADNAIATQLFRIAQEAVNNAVKHSGANRIAISLKSDGDRIIMQIRDDGSGYNSSVDTRGMGLRIMQYRSNLIGATLDVCTTKYGTTVSCVLKQELQRG